jgi:deoxyribodipyrimidine photolyase-like uncharacterized protein
LAATEQAQQANTKEHIISTEAEHAVSGRANQEHNSRARATATSNRHAHSTRSNFGNETDALGRSRTQMEHQLTSDELRNCCLLGDLDLGSRLISRVVNAHVD